MKRTISAGLLLLLSATPVGIRADPNGDWPSVGRDPGGTRFSPLTQITPKNVATLQQAWVFDTGSSNLQVTPLVIDGQMYVTAGSTVFALRPETGSIIWKYEAPGAVSRRGVVYWPGDVSTKPRLFSGAGEGRMVAIDARTGAVATGFGSGGFVDLKQSIRGDVDGRFSLVSPPAIYKNIVITGGNNNEPQPSSGLYGDIRGWDARTGKLLWSFHTVPRAGEPGVETWEGESWKNRSGTNMWAFITVDVERGLAFVPIGSPTSDYYGADRHGKNLYGNSLVALDANTGKLKWYQQLVHHDLWDFDLPAAPTLIDVVRDGTRIPAVAMITKMSTLFLFDRVTGEPIFGMEERPVPRSTVPGEESWPTQPFPLKPPPLGRMSFDPAKDFNPLDAEHDAYCRDLWNKNAMYTEGPFTPPGLKGMMVTFPSTLGGGNWNGVSFDPIRGLAFTNIMDLGQVARMQERKDPQTGSASYWRVGPWGTPVGRFWNPETKVPCSAPPFGELVAVDVNTGSIRWKVPLGYFESLKSKGFGDTGTLSMGGNIVTASGVLFIGATIDRRFRAFDSGTGKQLWETELEASAHSIPMTFMGKDGRQYVVVTAGGGSFLVSPPGTKIVAYALPGTGSPRSVRTVVAPASRHAPAAPGAARTGSRAIPDAASNARRGELPPGDGQDAVITMCSGCHGLDTSIAQRRTAKQWQAIVQAMLALGAPGSRDDASKTVVYLSWHYGRLNVNTATEEELVRVLDIPPARASAIVDYRNHEGALRSLDDLKKVPGLDAGEVARLKDRIVFAEK
jgi:competence ComEA-like helix-hairpin-helix protein